MVPGSWINDPNGLIYFKGWYHLFYQYNPKGCDWDSMHWGHAISRDMLHWKDLPIALYPDQPYDNHPEGGCFSGSAVEKDGTMYLFYSSTTRDGDKLRQTQSLATSEDGIHFKKYEGNPVIAHPPEGASAHFRDPKVIEANGKWYMVIGGAMGGTDVLDGDGRLFLYVSEDLYHWEYAGALLVSDGKLGTMFECPDLFWLDGKWVLTCSPICHPKYNKAMYCVGDIDFETCEFHIEKTGNMDCGFDYYAPQSFLDKNGNRVLIAWENGWLWMPWCDNWGPTGSENWRGVLSVPRRARLDADRNLLLEPIDEFRSLLGKTSVYHGFCARKTKRRLDLPDPYSYAVHISLSVKEAASRYLEIGLMEKEDKTALISVDLLNMLLSFDKRNADNYGKGVMTTAIAPSDGKLDLLILVDHSVVEIYVNHGQKCISCNVYPEEAQTGFWIGTPYSEARLDTLEISRVRSIWDC